MLGSLIQGGQFQIKPGAVVLVGAPLLELSVSVEEGWLEQIQARKGELLAVESPTLALVMGKLRRPMRRTAGGAALNIAFNLSRMCRRVAFVGKIGVDYEGLLCRREMRRAGIAAWLLLDQEQPTGKRLCLVSPDGQRTILAHFGASESIELEQMRGLEFHAAGVVHFEGYQVGRFELCERMMGRAKAQGALVSLDLASSSWVQARQRFFQRLIATQVDLLFGSYDQMYALTGESDPATICRQLGSKLRWVFLTHSSLGVYCSVDCKLYHLPLTPLTPVDRTGGGEAFCAGILHGIRCSWPLEETVALARALSAEVIQVRGSKIGLEGWQRIFDRFKRLAETAPGTRDGCKSL